MQYHVEHGVQPILTQTLWFVTKQFQTLFNIQFIGSQIVQYIFSDGVASIAAGVGNYNSVFSSIATNIIISVFLCTHERVSPFNLQFRNRRIAPKQSGQQKTWQPGNTVSSLVIYVIS